jgi:uncharacterized protein (TIGR03067 family)
MKLKKLMVMALSSIAWGAVGGPLSGQVPATQPAKSYRIECAVTQVSADGKEETLAKPTLITLEGQQAELAIGGQHAISKDRCETIPYGLSVRTKVSSLSQQKVRVDATLELTELQERSKAGVRLCGQTIRAIESVNLGASIKLIQKAGDSAERRLRLTVNEVCAAAQSNEFPRAPSIAVPPPLPAPEQVSLPQIANATTTVADPATPPLATNLAYPQSYSVLPPPAPCLNPPSSHAVNSSIEQKLDQILNRLEKIEHRLNETQKKKAATPDRPISKPMPPSQAGAFMFGVGVNSDAGLSGSIVLNERDFSISHSTGNGNYIRLPSGSMCILPPRTTEQQPVPEIKQAEHQVEQVLEKMDVSGLPIKIQAPSQSMSVATNRFTIEDDGRLRFEPFRAILWGKAEMTVLSSDAALLKSDKPVRSIADLANVTIAAAQFVGQTELKTVRLAPAAESDKQCCVDGCQGQRDSDQLKLQGSWRVVDGEMDGEKVNPAGCGMITIAGNKMVLPVEECCQVAFNLDTTQTPKRIRLLIQSKGKEARISGIYSLDGDTLRICLNDGGDDGSPPVEFLTQAGSHRQLYVLRRFKPGEKPSPSQAGFNFWTGFFK